MLCVADVAQTDPTSILRYDLAPDNDARRAHEEAFAAYATMLSMLDELASEKAGANLVTLHELAYETVRDRTGSPARLVTLGLRDFASNRGRVSAAERLPLDDKLFAIKGPADLTIATVRGRVAVPTMSPGIHAARSIFQCPAGGPWRLLSDPYRGLKSPR